jgi:phenylacetate-CoA ligase
VAAYSERIYHKLPVTLQNVAVTIRGLELFRERYGRAGRDFGRFLAHSANWDDVSIGQYQDQCLREIVGHAMRTVPFYRELAAGGPVSVSCREDLAHLPIIEKKQLRDAPEYFQADRNSYRGKPIRLGTSGTSGTPLKINCDVACRQKHYAFWSRLRRSFGIGANTWRATFFGRILFAPERSQPPFWRYDFAQRNLLFSSYHLSPAYLPAICEMLRRRQCSEIVGYPSSLFLVADHIVSRGLPPLRPRVVFTTAETLLAQQRSLLERAFDCPVIDQYGCTEMVIFVAQCANGTYHVHPEHGFLEILLPDGTPAPPGMAGEAVCTGFLNRAMPLIRYRLGDRLVAGSGRCPCGSAFPTLDSIEGRMDDILYAPDGRPLPRLDPIFKTLGGIRETRIIQENPDSLILEIATDPDFGPLQEQELRAEIHKRTGTDMIIYLRRVAAIPKDPNGKFKAVESRLARRPSPVSLPRRSP